jgi:hypothetical protein
LSGGDADGEWNGLPDIPLTRSGIVLAKQIPPKIGDASAVRAAEIVLTHWFIWKFAD